MGEPRLSFYDHHRQRYADSVPIHDRWEAEFMVGDYEKGEAGVGELGEFRIALHRFQQENHLTPQMQVFGDGLKAARLLLALADAAGVELLGDVDGQDTFSRRLLDLGLADHSDRPLASAVMVGARGTARL